MRLRGLSARVVAAAGAAVAVGLLLTGVAIVLLAARDDRHALDRDLLRVADRRARPALLAVQGTAAGGAALGPDDDRFVRVLNATGATVGRGGAAIPAGFPAGAGAGERAATVTAGGEGWRVVARRLAGGRTLQVAARLAPLHERARRLAWTVAIVALLALMATSLLVRALTGVALAPLGRLRAAAREFGATADPARRVPADSATAEVDELAGDLNAMLARLEVAGTERAAALEAARRFAADAGHELRTPLTSLSINLSSLHGDDAVVRAAQADLERLTALVEQLQALARSGSGPPARVEPVDLAELADAAVTAARRRHPEATIALDVPTTVAPLAGDPDGLRALLDNLVENAARHGRGGRDHVRVVVTAGLGTLTVDDDGPGVPAAERATVLSRFGRGAGAHGPGSGLGLAIAAAQAQRHGGTLTLSASPLGGLRATATLRPS
jgi:two-component system, OmpR family, sensor histidine kinase PrrB